MMQLQSHTHARFYLMLLDLQHYTNTFAFFSFTITQGFLWSTIRYLGDVTSEPNLPLWKTIVWIPVWIGLIKWYQSALFMNTYGIGVTLGLCVGVALPAGLATTHFRKALDAYSLLNTNFELAEFVYDFQVSFAIYSAIGVVMMGTFIVVAILHMRSLRETMSEITPRNKLPTCAEANLQKRIQAQYSSLLVVLALFSITVTLFEGLVLFTTIDARRIVVDGNSNEVASSFTGTQF
ncbi:hypothetical protein RQP46_000947 [Phenoliferia psychrophenolica]